MVLRSKLQTLSLLGFCLNASVLFAQLVQPGTVAGTGIVAGTIFDASNGQPIRGAAVAVIEAAGKQTVTDTDGRYQISLPEGRYSIKVSAQNYLEAKIEEIVIKSNEATEASTVMALASNVTKVDVVETASAVMATSEAMLQERKLSSVVSDSLSNEELKKSVSSDAAGALQKVTGVSVVDSGYVYVRGLGERYSSTMLNSAMIPTTEPEKRVVPLDLFPAALIDNIKILKTYSPDLPGEFSGGLVQMQTVEFPTQKVLSVSFSTGLNSATSFRRSADYLGGSTDYWGFDDGTRALPGLIPTDKRIVQGTFNQQELQALGRSFATNWEPKQVTSMRPTQSYSVVGGNTFGRVGLVGALTFQNKPQNQFEIQRYLRHDGVQPFIFSNYEDFNVYNQAARLGAVLNAAIRLSPSNKLIFRNTLTHDADKEARVFSGYDGGIDGNMNSERLRYIERGLLSTGVEGEHAVAKLGNSLFRWQMTYSQSSRNEPDLREVIRGKLPDGRYSYLALSNSGQRFFTDLKDRIYEPLAEFAKPFYKGSFTGILKFGYRGTFRSRDFEARRFRFIPQRTTTLNLFLPSDQLFAKENIRPDGFQIIEFTRATDSYTADMDIHAGFAMVDLALGGRWRVVGGVRIEDANIKVITLDPLVPSATPSVANLVNRDPMPSVNVIYALTPRQNLRFGYSATVTRPDFRELSPFDFNNVQGGFVTQGNPNLVRGTIDNYDARWEAFTGGGGVMAASFFAKKFVDPIEVTILPANDLRQGFVNAKGALNVGFELEYRRSLAFLSQRLRELAVSGNFTFVDSNIEIKPEDAFLLTSKQRPLLGQSRYIYNVMTEWNRPKWRSNARFYLNWVSRRISDVGTFALPDIYQEGNTFIDFAYQYTFDEKGKWTMKFNAENLANNHYHWTQGDILQRSFRLGRTFTVGVSYTIF